MRLFAVILRREFLSRFRTKAFAITTLVSAVFLLGAIVFAPMRSALGGNAADPAVRLVCSDTAACAIVRARLAENHVRVLGTAVDAAAMAAGAAQGADATVLVRRDPRRGSMSIRYVSWTARGTQAVPGVRRLAGYAQERAVLDARGGIPVPLSFTVVSASPASAVAAPVDGSIGMAFVMLLYFAVTGYGLFVAAGVLEEKSTRTMDVVLSSVPATTLLLAKLIGIGFLGIVQMLIVLSLATAMFVVMLALGPSALLAPFLDPHMMSSASAFPVEKQVLLFVFFLVGYFSYASLFALVAAAVPDGERVRQYANVLFLPLYYAFFLAVTSSGTPDSPTMRIASLVPLVSPMVMFSRITFGVSSGPEIVLSVLASLAFVAVVLALAVRAYRAPALFRSVSGRRRRAATAAPGATRRPAESPVTAA